MKYDSSALNAQHTDAKKIEMLQLLLVHLPLRSCLSGIGPKYMLEVSANGVKNWWHTIPTKGVSCSKIH
jgi:hypothetical protein